MYLSFELIPFASGLIQKQAVAELIKCNEETERVGLALTQAQAIDLVETRAASLLNNGRIEFGGGVIHKIVREFCYSPYIYKENYVQTIHELIEIFYYYKNETMDLIADDDLIQFMKSAFDGVCQGSLDLLSSRELYQLARNLRFGYAADASEDGVLENEGENYE